MVVYLKHVVVYALAYAQPNGARHSRRERSSQTVTSKVRPGASKSLSANRCVSQKGRNSKAGGRSSAPWPTRSPMVPDTHDRTPGWLHRHRTQISVTNLSILWTYKLLILSLLLVIPTIGTDLQGGREELGPLAHTQPHGPRDRLADVPGTDFWTRRY